MLRTAMTSSRTSRSREGLGSRFAGLAGSFSFCGLREPYGWENVWLLRTNLQTDEISVVVFLHEGQVTALFLPKQSRNKMMNVTFGLLNCPSYSSIMLAACPVHLFYSLVFPTEDAERNLGG